MTRSDLTSSFGNVVIVGVGLLGGSLALALRRSGRVAKLIGVGRIAERLQVAQSKGLIDDYATDVATVAGQANIIVFCTPVQKIAKGVLNAAEHCRPGTLITDVGSVKAPLCRAVSGQLPDGVTFIGSHPLAGSEKQGFEHANAKLFRGKLCVITPDPNSGDVGEQTQRLSSFWEAAGAKVKLLSAETHDHIASDISHLPHLIASTLAMSLNASNRDWAATGFRDTTRVASGDPSIWTDILLDNSDCLLESLKRFESHLGEFRRAIERGRVEDLTSLLAMAKLKRDELNDM
ncbi:MAG: prephenate dehydrogenase [Planctomycetota bacterium]|nr:prephenate dehydrogenase [Planctomycetota bacterium]MDA1211770.1 prephenate dehydrogenase [Planctomycetota bacterium]